MGKLAQLDVLIVGLRGVGVEAAKNLILAGPRSVVLHDDEVVEARDLGANVRVPYPPVRPPPSCPCLPTSERSAS